MIDFNLIRPDGTGKYSPNLHRFVTSKRAKAFGSNQVFQTGSILNRDEFSEFWRPSEIIIGDGSRENGVGGRTLKSIIFGERGVWSQCFHYSPAFNLRDITEQFWSEYVRIGRCAWDHSHTRHMIGDKDRFHYIAGGRQRECQWCGRVFEAEVTVEPVIKFEERTTWREYRDSSPATLLHPMGSCGEAV